MLTGLPDLDPNFRVLDTAGEVCSCLVGGWTRTSFWVCWHCPAVPQACALET